MSAPLCTVCLDTGSKSQHMQGDLDCIACEVALERANLDGLIERQRFPELREMVWKAYQLGKAADAPVVPVAAQPVVQTISADDVQWITNDNAELGVKIGNQFFFLYKGHSLVYGDGTHDDGKPMMYRPVFKREFGECVHPLNHNDYSKIGTVSLSDSDEWKEISAAPQPAASVTDVAKDAARLMFAMQDIDGFTTVAWDKYDYAVHIAGANGRDEPTQEDELNGVRRLIDAAIAAQQGEKTK